MHRKPRIHFTDAVYPILEKLRAFGKQHTFSEACGIAARRVQNSPHLSLAKLADLRNHTHAPLGRAANLLTSKTESEPALKGRLRERLTER